MEKPVIYGDEGRFRAAVTRAINSGDDLLAQAEGVRKQIGQAGDGWDRYAIEEAWEADFRRWFMGTGRTLVRYLREQFAGSLSQMRAGVHPPLSEDDGLPTLAAGLPPDDGRHTIHLDEGEEWLRKTLDELRELQSVLAPPKRRGATEQPPPRKRSRWVPSWWKLGTAGSIASLVGVPLAVAGIILAVVLR
jgi:hypothetical protein